MMKKLLSAALAVCLVLTATASAVFAATESSFSDVTSPEYDWAIKDIESMTREGIIKGYSDYTFRPANAIKKIEMLLLLARAAQFLNDDYAPFTELATQLYANVLDDYDLGESYNRYKPEVSFLLYKGIIDASELDSLLTESNAALKRYEAAVLLTKLMGGEEEARSNIAPVLEYADFTDIPVSARSYVEYVTENGIMNGVSANSFGPKENVNRAQAAVILNRVLNHLDYSVRAGIVEDINTGNGHITLYNEKTDNDYDIPVNFRTVKITKDGSAARASAIEQGNYALALYSGKTVISLEVLSSLDEMETVSCVLVDADGNDDYITLTVRIDASGKEHNYRIYTNAMPQVTFEGKEIEFEDLRSGYAATLVIADGEIISIAARTAGSNNSRAASGVVAGIEVSPEYVLTVLLNDDTISDYYMSGSVTVTRNGRSASLRDILIGDSVSITERDGLVTKIVATSSQRNASGILSTILISSSSSLGVRANGEETLYPVAANAQFEVDGGEATIYDLRLGAAVDMELEGTSIVYLNASTDTASHQIFGTITDINLAYGYITVEDNNGNTQQLFLDMAGDTVRTTVIDSTTGERVRIANLDGGEYILAVGSYPNGTFTVTSIIIIPE